MSSRREDRKLTETQVIAFLGKKNQGLKNQGLKNQGLKKQGLEGTLIGFRKDTKTCMSKNPPLNITVTVLFNDRTYITYCKNYDDKSEDIIKKQIIDDFVSEEFQPIIEIYSQKDMLREIPHREAPPPPKSIRKSKVSATPSVTPSARARSQVSKRNWPLPYGWEKSHDDKGREYYFDFITGISQWEHPSPMFSPSPSARVASLVKEARNCTKPNNKPNPPIPLGKPSEYYKSSLKRPLPLGWGEYWNKDNGTYYYFNKETNTSQWFPPPENKVQASSIKEDITGTLQREQNEEISERIITYFNSNPLPSTRKDLYKKEEIKGDGNCFYYAILRSLEKIVHPLPEFWEERFDDETKKSYYINNELSPPKAQWEHPSLPKIAINDREDKIDLVANFKNLIANHSRVNKDLIDRYTIVKKHDGSNELVYHMDNFEYAEEFSYQAVANYLDCYIYIYMEKTPDSEIDYRRKRNLDVINNDHWCVYYPDGKNNQTKYEIVNSIDENEVVVPTRDHPSCDHRKSSGVKLEENYDEIEYFKKNEAGETFVVPEYMENPTEFIKKRKNEILGPFIEIESNENHFGLYIKMVNQNHFESLHKFGNLASPKIETSLFEKYSNILKAKKKQISPMDKLERIKTFIQKMRTNSEQPVILFKKLQHELIKLIPKTKQSEIDTNLYNYLMKKMPSDVVASSRKRSRLGKKRRQSRQNQNSKPGKQNKKNKKGKRSKHRKKGRKSSKKEKKK